MVPVTNDSEICVCDNFLSLFFLNRGINSCRDIQDIIDEISETDILQAKLKTMSEKCKGSCTSTQIENLY